MYEIFGAALGALAVIGIPLAAWSSRRATREGRLLLRVERLGSAFALMPPSSEKNTFENQLTAVVADLNSWMNVDNARRRKLLRSVNGFIYVLGAIALSLSPVYTRPTMNLSQSFLLGILIGLAISGLRGCASLLVERDARLKSARAAKESEESASALRMAALLQGEPATSERTERKSL